MHRSRALALTSLAASLLAATPAASSGQAGSVTGAISASLDIVYAPLSGSAVRPLDFGAIIPGTSSVTIAPSSAQGGEFRISGTQGRKSIDISFTLPTGLTGPAGATIPLSFAGNKAALCELDTTGSCIASSFVAWDPTVTTTFHDTPYRYNPARTQYTDGQYQVRLGGEVTPAPGQAPGRYTGAIGVLLVLN